MQKNPRITAFTIFELLRENQLGVKLPPTKTRVKMIVVLLKNSLFLSKLIEFSEKAIYNSLPKNNLKALFLACGGVTFYRFCIAKIDIPRVDNSSQLATKASGHGILTCYLYSAWSKCISQEGQVGFGFAFKTKPEFCVSQFSPVFVAQLYFDPSLFYRFDHHLLSSFKATPKRYLTLPSNFIYRMLL